VQRHGIEFGRFEHSHEFSVHGPLTRHSIPPIVWQATTARRWSLKAVALGAASTALALLAVPVSVGVMPPSSVQSAHFLVAVFGGQQDDHWVALGAAPRSPAPHRAAHSKQTTRIEQSR
jgi:hypothetical protein